MNDRFRGMRLTGDPDRDFAALLIAHHEDLIFLARTQLEHGGDQQLRRLAQRILDEQQAQISELKEWQIRRRQAGYRGQPDQPPHGSGPLDQKSSQTAETTPTPQVQAANPSQPVPKLATPSGSLPSVSGTVEEVDAAQGKITIDHEPIPNLDMDAMTMIFRTPDPSILKGLKAGDRIRFQADRVNGRISVVRIQR
jgi:Cu/Ag efflux protein CusF